jgi:hypothetical protein
LSYALLAGALLYTVRTPRKWLKAHLQECIILAGPIWATCENAYAQVGFKNPIKNEKLTNEIKILNHENVKNEDLTVMLQMARQMISCSSRKSTPNSEGKKGVLELNSENVK